MLFYLIFTSLVGGKSQTKTKKQKLMGFNFDYNNN